jgi:hypothetical protein
MKITPILSPEWFCVGFLDASGDDAARGEDMFAASLPDGTTIDAGWSSEGDPHGRFKVVCYRDFTMLFPPYETGDAEEAKVHIEFLASELSKHVVSVPVEWCTQSENIRHAIDNHLYPPRLGESAPNAKLTADQVKDIRSRTYRRGDYGPWSVEFGISQTAIRMAHQGKSFASTAQVAAAE